MKELSKYLSYLLRHNYKKLDLDMDRYGYVDVDLLINNINNEGKYCISKDLLERIVSEDKKGRYKYNHDHTRIKACQGHSIESVEVELKYRVPPKYLYHGTTKEAYSKIVESGYISKMNRHAVHLNEDINKAWDSAKRWRKSAVVLKINALKLYEDGYHIGISDNYVWCSEDIKYKYIEEVIGE